MAVALEDRQPATWLCESSTAEARPPAENHVVVDLNPKQAESVGRNGDEKMKTDTKATAGYQRIRTLMFRDCRQRAFLAAMVNFPAQRHGKRDEFDITVYLAVNPVVMPLQASGVIACVERGVSLPMSGCGCTQPPCGAWPSAAAGAASLLHVRVLANGKKGLRQRRV